MSHPTNGDESGNQSGGNRQGGSLGQGWDSHDNAADAPFDAQSDATQVIPSAQPDAGDQGDAGQFDDGQYDSPQGNWQDVSQEAPAQGSEAADVGGSANSGQGYGNEDFASEEPTYAQRREAEPAGYGQESAPQPNQQAGQQGWSQPASQNQGGYGQQAAPQPNQQAGRQGGWGQQSAPQPNQQAGQQGGGQGQQGNQSPSAASQAASQAQAQVGRVMSGAGDGLGALASDLQFKKSLTGKLASLVFLVTIVWAVLDFLSKLAFDFGSRDIGGGNSIGNVGTGTALMNTLTNAVWLVLVIGITRLVLELAVNVARIANRDKD